MSTYCSVEGPLDFANLGPLPTAVNSLALKSYCFYAAMSEVLGTKK
jgi:hypothetical protein